MDAIRTTTAPGILERDSVRMLAETGVYESGRERVITHGDWHGGIYLRFGGESHHIDFEELVGASVWLYPQTDVFVDLRAARTRDVATCATESPTPPSTTSTPTCPG